MPYSEQTWNDGEAGGTPVSAARLTHMETGIGDALAQADNLSDLANAGTARTNLGLGDSAVKNTGTSAGTVAAGDHNHSGTYASASHTHAAADTTSGSFDIARVPTGTSGTTVALGNHSHLGSNASISLTGNVTTYHGTPTVYDRGDGWITADGGIESNGTNNANTTLVTVPSGYRPSTTKQFTMRHTGTSASTGTITLNTDGTITYNSSFASGAQMDLTGVQWRKA